MTQYLHQLGYSNSPEGEPVRRDVVDRIKTEIIAPYLKTQAKSHRVGSYGAKLTFQRLLGTYVGNGEAIQALLEAGFTAEAEGGKSPNASFNANPREYNPLRDALIDRLDIQDAARKGAPVPVLLKLSCLTISSGEHPEPHLEWEQMHPKTRLLLNGCPISIGDRIKDTDGELLTVRHSIGEVLACYDNPLYGALTFKKWRKTVYAQGAEVVTAN